MHPALSVIIFTVASGMGLGTLMLAVPLGLPEAGLLSRNESLAGVSVGLILTTIGLLASTQHLANPRNAWRSFSRFKSSWLSREAVFALLLYPFALFYLFGLWTTPQPAWLFELSGLTATLLALLTLFATGMIYAVLRTIPQWNNALVPANYVLLGLASGALVLVLIVTAYGGYAKAFVLIAVFSLLVAALGKGLYYVWIGKPQGPTINTATGFTRARVRLFDIGHSAGTFNTREFGYQAPVELVKYLRWGVFVMGFIVPVGFAVMVWNTGSILASGLALASATVGLLTERWLFFAEARHAVNLFHGSQNLGFNSRVQLKSRLE